jgi:transposase
MESTVTIGLDLGKSVFQIHGVDAGGAVVVHRRLTRGKLLHFFGNRRPALDAQSRSFHAPNRSMDSAWLGRTIASSGLP